LADLTDHHGFFFISAHKVEHFDRIERLGGSNYNKNSDNPPNL
jgi:hypothetical protein